MAEIVILAEFRASRGGPKIPPYPDADILTTPIEEAFRFWAAWWPWWMVETVRRRD